jgi:hypothetical protein
MSNAKKRAAPSGKSATSNADSPKHKPCACSGQLHFHGFPPPPDPFRGPLVEWLEAHPGWWGCQYLCGTLGVDSRTLRLQSQTSEGRVIFSSALGGLAATVHADAVEVLACVAEMEGRKSAMSKRIRETLKRAGIGGTP